jgi:ATP-dependent helicase IRC3
MKLRPYQERWLEAVADRYQAGINRQLGKAATGLGKTVLFTNIKKHLGLKKRILILAHRDELIRQAVDKIRKWNHGDSVGVEMADERAGDAQWVVASVQTLGRSGSKRIEQFDPEEFDAIVCDEAHHATATTYRKVFDHFRVEDCPERLLLGVTATVRRADGTGLGEIFQEIVFDYSILDGIRDGYLADLRGYRVPTNISLDKVHTRAGDFDLGELGKEIDTDARNELVIKAWLEHGEDRRTIGFGVDIRHCQRLADAAKRYGISAEAIWGDDPARAAKLGLHRKGHVKILFNCQVLTEGYDDPGIACILWCRPTQSESFYIQAVGRGTRIPEGIENLKHAAEYNIPVDKKDCILIDVVDTTKRHSLVSLASLHGVQADVDLKGKSLVEVVDELEAVKAKRPLVDVSAIPANDIDELVRRAEEIDLFQVKYAPEIIQLSQYQWHKTGPFSYVLQLAEGDAVLIGKTFLDKWEVIGNVNGNRLYQSWNTFEEALEHADSTVKILGGRNAVTIAKREAKWHDEQPTPAQLKLCARFGVKVPANATKGEVHKKLGEVFMRVNRKRFEQLRRNEVTK